VTSDKADVSDEDAPVVAKGKGKAARSSSTAASAKKKKSAAAAAGEQGEEEQEGAGVQQPPVGVTELLELERQKRAARPAGSITIMR